MGIDVDVEALISEAHAEATPEIATEGDGSDAQVETGTGDESSTQSKGTRVLQYKGETISIDDAKFQNFAQQGYDYNIKMRDFNIEKKLFESERESMKEIIEINDYAKANPDWLKTVQDHWAAEQSGAGTRDPASLESRFQQLQARQDARDQKDIIRQNAALEADQELSISSFKENNSDHDWNTKDEYGNTLEDRIGHMMVEKKIRDFDVAATYLLKDEMLKRKALAAKESAGAAIQKANKLGLGQVTKKSVLGVKPAEDVRSKSYDQLFSEGYEEYGNG